MSLQNKVLWSEGLFLQPQHFQQQERYLEWLVNARSSTSGGLFWGFSSLRIDETALNLGKLALAEGRGVLPDGTLFDFPGQGPAPEPLEVPHDARDARVVLGIPLARAGQPDVDLAGKAQARYAAHVAEVPDATSSESRAESLQVCKLDLRLMLERDVPDGFAAIGVAQVVERDSAGRVNLDRSYVPPCLAVREQGVLAALLKEVAGLVAQRADALAAAMGQPGRAGVGEIVDFLFLQVANRYASLLPHLERHPSLHPERMYSVFLEMAGELATFARDNRRAPEFPAYSHDDVRRSFAPVVAELRRALSMVIEQSAVPIELQDRKYGVRVAIVPDRSLFRSASFVLAVSAQVPGDALRAHFPAQVKIGPVERLRDLVNLQLPGVALKALPVAPRQIPYSAGASYFELERNSELWAQLDRSGGLAMHIAGEIPGLALEMWAIRG